MSNDPNSPLPPPSPYGNYAPGYFYPPAPVQANPLDFSAGSDELKSRPVKKHASQWWIGIVAVSAVFIACGVGYFVWNNMQFKKDGARLIEIRREKSLLQQRVNITLPAKNDFEREIADKVLREWRAKNSDMLQERRHEADF